jgi:hypothetical protein
VRVYTVIRLCMRDGTSPVCTCAYITFPRRLRTYQTQRNISSKKLVHVKCCLHNFYVVGKIINYTYYFLVVLVLPRVCTFLERPYTYTDYNLHHYGNTTLRGRVVIQVYVYKVCTLRVYIIPDSITLLTLLLH